MSSIELKAVEKWFGTVQVIKGVDLAVEQGEFIIFVGPSGCGKSTLLRMIAGLEETSRGQIMIAGRDATAEPPSKRGLAMVFQSYALYPHMSVRDNMGFSLKAAGVPKAELDRQVNEAAKVLKLEPFLDRRPRDLSGVSASPSADPSCGSRRRSCSMSRCPIWTQRCASRCGMKSLNCIRP